MYSASQALQMLREETAAENIHLLLLLYEIQERLSSKTL